MTSRPAWVDGSLYPFESRFHQSPDGAMHYVDEGQGMPVVMVHGNPSWSFAYRDVIRGLRDGSRCIAVDHLGFGLSEKPAGADYSPEAHARRLDSFIEGLGLKDIILVVQDWGGPIGLAYAVRRPRNVRGLVILNTWMWPVDGDPHFERFSRWMGGPLGRFLIRRLNVFVNAVMKRAVADPRTSLPPRVHRHYQLALPDAASRIACAAFPGHILGSRRFLASLWDARAALAGKPAKVIWGMKDIAFRAKELDRWRELLPEAEVSVLPDCGHYVQEERSVEVVGLLRSWLPALEAAKSLRVHRKG